MTEAERYEKSDAKPNKKSGKVPPQQLWMDLISECINDAPAHLKNYLQTMSSLGNVPRKEKPFRNFAANSLNLQKPQHAPVVGEIWTFLKTRQQEQQQRQQQKEANNSKNNSNYKPSDDTQGKDKKEQPSTPAAEASAKDESDGAASDSDESSKKASNSGAENVAESRSTRSDGLQAGALPTTVTRKTVKKAMKKVLKKAHGHALKFKLLRKEVKVHLGLKSKIKSSDKKMLKALIHENVAKTEEQAKKDKAVFVKEGKIIKLKR